MVERILRTSLVFFSIVFMIFSPLLSIPLVNAQSTDYLASCPVGSTDLNCNPPTLIEVQYTVVRLIYATWACGGFIFLILLLLIGWTYMTSGGDSGKIEEAKKRGGQWIIGFLLFFLSRAIVATMMRGLIGDNPCYNSLRDPGFTFFFNDVCTDGDIAPTSTPDPSLIASSTDGVGGCCDSSGTGLNGCFSADGSIPAEQCTVANGSCQSGSSCRVATSSAQFLNLINTSCNQVTREIRTSDGYTLVCNRTNPVTGESKWQGSGPTPSVGFPLPQCSYFDSDTDTGSVCNTICRNGSPNPVTICSARAYDVPNDPVDRPVWIKCLCVGNNLEGNCTATFYEQSLCEQ